jgi:hypothetical protein
MVRSYSYFNHPGLLTNMKYSLTAFFLLLTFSLRAQDSTLFDSKFKFKEGIYTSYTEVLKNSPKFQVSLLDVKVEPFFGNVSIYYYDKLGKQKKFTDSLFAIVHEGKFGIIYRKQFNKLILTGPISTFIIRTYYNDVAGNPHNIDRLFYVDLMTGNIEELYQRSISDVIKRDMSLFHEFEEMSTSKRAKTLYKFILKYNLRNPIYIKNY